MSTAHLGPKISQVTSHFESKGQENTNCKGRAKLNRKLFRTIEKVTEMFCFLKKTCNLGLLFTCIFDFASFIIVDLFPCAHKNLGTHNLWGGGISNHWVRKGWLPRIAISDNSKAVPASLRCIHGRRHLYTAALSQVLSKHSVEVLKIS